MFHCSSFKYLGTHISNDCKLDTEISYRVSQASRALGRLQTRVFKNHNLSIHTKVEVYTAVCLSILLYGSESWTIYARHLKTLEAWHIRSLRVILNVTWRDKLTHKEIFRRTGSTSLESQLGRRQLRWMGHVIRMDATRLPKQLLYGELSSGLRKAGGQKKRHKDYMKTVLNKFDISPERLESLAADRNEWRSKCHEGARKCEQKRNERMQLRRERRHNQDTDVASEDRRYPCVICGMACRSRIGLFSHTQAHQRGGDEAVVVVPDGQP